MPENESYTFRTAISGFHKQDVTNYISKTAQAHQKEVQELQRQLEEANSEIEELRVLLMTLEQAGEPLASTLDAPPEQATGDEAAASQEDGESLVNQELMAYRRAEAVERVAYGRAKKLYEQMQGLCDRSARQAEDARETAQSALDVIAEQLARLQDASAACQDSLSETSKELRAMERTVPDPAEALEVE